MLWMWIVAGPNGSGKTTFVRSGFIQDAIAEPMAMLNLDEIAAKLTLQEPDADALERSRVA